MPYVNYPFTKTDRQGRKIWDILRKKCLSCGTPFVTRNPDKLYCSRKCNHNEVMRRKRAKKAVNSSKQPGI